MNQELPPGRRRDCPFCGRLVVFQDAERTVHHEIPACKEYLRLVEKHGGELIGQTYSYASKR